jgi:glycerate dehydrogenase
MKERIVILDGYALNPGDLSWEPLRTYGDLVVYDQTPEDRVIERIQEATMVLTNDTPISSEAIKAAKDLIYIGVMSTGYDVVDVETAHARNITVTNVPSYSTYSVAQMTFALLLEICHHVGHHDTEVHRGRWTNHNDFCFCDYPGIELHGKTLGVVGYGPIGETVAKIAAAFGMKVLVYTRNAHLRKIESHIKFVPLDYLFSESNVITFHIPSKKETRSLVNASSISRMKSNVILINTARGALFNEKDVADALHAGHIGFAALDVLSEEPPSADNPLLHAPHCIITPHIAWATTEARKRCVEVSCSNLIKFLEGNTINIV